MVEPAQNDATPGEDTRETGEHRALVKYTVETTDLGDIGAYIAILVLALGATKYTSQDYVFTTLGMPVALAFAQTAWWYFDEVRPARGMSSWRSD